MESEAVWREFRQKLAEGTLTDDDCYPIIGVRFGAFLTDPDWSSLKEMIVGTDSPCFEEGEHLLIARLRPDEPQEVRIDFLVEPERWFLYMVDAVTVPIRSIPQTPFSEFPPVPFRDESFLRAEERISFQLRVYSRVKQDKGKEEALSWLRDGGGKRVNASAWMPYFIPRKAFVVLVAWHESRLGGEAVSIDEFTDTRCVLRYSDHIWFRLYDTATHLRNVVSRDEYREIFEYIWIDRARHSDWAIDFAYDGYETTIVLTHDG